MAEVSPQVVEAPLQESDLSEENAADVREFADGSKLLTSHLVTFNDPEHGQCLQQVYATTGAEDSEAQRALPAAKADGDAKLLAMMQKLHDQLLALQEADPEAYAKLVGTVPEPTITVCDARLRASCWAGEFFCEEASGAGTTERTREELAELDRESSHYWEPKD